MSRTFYLMIELDNAAFSEGEGAEIARILREVADRVEGRGRASGTERDANGNRVCAWTVAESGSVAEVVGSPLSVEFGRAVTVERCRIPSAREGFVPAGTPVFLAHRDTDNPIPPHVRDRNVAALVHPWNVMHDLRSALD